MLFRDLQMERWSVGALERGACCGLAVFGKRIGSRWEADRRSLGSGSGIVAD